LVLCYKTKFLCSDHAIFTHE